MAEPAEPARSLDARVLVLAPLGRDAAVVAETLGQSGIATAPVRDVGDLVTGIHAGAAVVLLTEEALTAATATELREALAVQPSWSDLPILLLMAADDGHVRDTVHSIAALQSERNVTVLARPIPAVTLVTAVRSALRARLRQYEVRDLLDRERAAREQAETATRIKDAFLATVSHELRTPLSAILIWSQLLEQGRLTEEQTREAMHAIISSAEAQSRLVEDLIDVSRMLTGKVRLEARAHALAPIVGGAIELLRATADTKGVRLDAQLGACPELVWIDAERVQQIFWNLVSNAVKFTPAGGLVSIRLVPEPGHIQVVIRDTGEGISPEFLPHVFERFRQADPAATRRHGGLGLGLTIARQLVELQGGTIRAESDGIGTGATFTVRLPTVTHGIG